MSFVMEANSCAELATSSEDAFISSVIAAISSADAETSCETEDAFCTFI